MHYYDPIGDALRVPSAAEVACHAGDCTATVSVTYLDRDRIELELYLTSSRAPRKSALTIPCRWKRFGAALADRRHVDPTRSSVRPVVGPSALIRALLRAIGRADIDVDDDEQLLEALEGQRVIARVKVEPILTLVFGADSNRAMWPVGYRANYTLTIVRFLSLPR